MNIHPVGVAANLPAATPLVAEACKHRVPAVYSVEDVVDIDIAFAGVEAVLLEENLKTIALCGQPSVRHRSQSFSVLDRRSASSAVVGCG